MKKSKPIKAASKKIRSEELDARFDAGKSILEYADLDTGTFRVNVDFPVWMVTAMDQEANRLGVGRVAVLKTWIADRIAAVKIEHSQTA